MIYKICGKCNKELDIKEFSWKNKKLGKRSWCCKSCQKKYHLRHYIDNKEDYIRKASLQRIKIKQEIVDYLKTKKCMDCGIDDWRLLDFDHVKGEKVGNISELYINRSRKILWDEIEKCEIVCSNCHRLRTYKRGNFLNNFLS